MSTAYALAASTIQAQRGPSSPSLRVCLQAAVLSAGGQLPFPEPAHAQASSGGHGGSVQCLLQPPTFSRSSP